MKKRIIRIFIFIGIFAFFGGIFLLFSSRVDYSRGTAKESQIVVIEKGENFVDVAKKLKEKKLISREIYFIYYAWNNDLDKKIIAGEYEINPELTIPEIIRILVEGETRPAYAKITFPEGWTILEMSKRLNGKNLPGDEFLKLASNPSTELISEFDFFQDKPLKNSLEGYLFPDTYFFAPDASAEGIIVKMLKNFNTKVDAEIRTEIEKQNKSIFEILTMASIIETEVKVDSDRKTVSGIFWKRLGIEMALQSDATVSYALGGEKKIQHNANDINIDSPYNTYRFKGLPPGPVSNPGISSIRAAVYPTQTDYLYFLNNPNTGETIFAQTFEQHIQNKTANGL
ncbi:MAG: hypothetical protein ACD_11C00026G0013 [uncultured bacterium]|nr:MAG: hypothetical protein ACD_11C00026G0013 [uncultured bacterium]HBR72057.1 endolytic transglycosylase MltG [Candidatus Moranbacteria bacterium]